MNAHAPNGSPAGIAVLARLLAAGDKGETHVKVAKDLEPLLASIGAGSALTGFLDRTIADLAAAGLIAAAGKKSEKLTLTDAGRLQALDALGLDALPPKTTWAKLKKGYLPALALGLPVPKGAALKTFEGKGFEAAVLKAAYRLPLADVPTSKAATEALLWSLMGVRTSEPFNLANIKKHLLTRALGGGVSINEKTGLRRLLTKAIEARRDQDAELREAVVRRWLAGRPVGSDEVAQTTTPEPAPSPPAPVDLPVFAARVKQAARHCPTGRFGDDRVFIAHVWHALGGDPAVAGLDLEGFKRRLADANRARLLDLSRADLVEAMDPDDVRSSETLHHGASFHFIRF